MTVTITRNDRGDDWLVWIQLEPGDPTRLGESFVVGTGETRDGAVADAVRELEFAVAKLQAPAGTIGELEIA